MDERFLFNPLANPRGFTCISKKIGKKTNVHTCMSIIKISEYKYTLVYMHIHVNM